VNPPRVSVLINCYNADKFLSCAIDSVLAQTYRDFELVIWDNRSADRTAEICKSYADSRIRYLLAPEHTDLGRARIAAFQCLRGDLIAILDADDLAYPTRLASQVSFLNENPEVVLVGSWAKQIDEEGNVTGEYRPSSVVGDLLNDLVCGNPLINSSVMYRKHVAIEIGGYSSFYSLSQDYDLALKMVRSGGIAVQGQFLCRYRVLGSSLTRSKATRVLAATETLSLLRYAAGVLPVSQKFTRLNKRAQTIAKIKLGLYEFESGAWARGMSKVALLIIMNPGVFLQYGPIKRFLQKFCIG
jgi:glycosyltransferase involved in cell wall biosynthesis